MRKVLLLWAPAASGCYAGYVPRQPGQIAESIHYGQPVLYKNGNMVPLGAAFGGLVDLTADDAPAHDTAMLAHSDAVTGWLLYAGGFASGIAGAVVLATAPRTTAELNEPPRPIISDERGEVAGGLLTVGVVGLIAAIPYLIAGQEHSVDAINMYNDDMSQVRAP
jgi:hypothetical protein